ncbi:Helix-turn-helix domain-containing protein [Chitinophaga sp. YR627]|uniref:helix-turn-helix domain-containing protein n=1 Tax=Chitinophaga sp. YR627 TaxID=1881041 RepID=UPI0008E90827|nr:AraC family transcriptional regulator [Chitinophaga sp. YR627]SFM77297.1 Helix-turn-helix domain-containing protein [Chitinophaga sp. YR627]
MEKMESLEGFYQDKFNRPPDGLKQDNIHFNLFSFDDCEGTATIKYRRRDFYKVTLSWGRNILHYGDTSLEVNGPALAFFSPDVPYTIDLPDGMMMGDYFIFTEAYFNAQYRNSIRDLPVFAAGARPVFLLNKTQEKTARGIFKKMKQELATDYEFKHDLIRNYIVELIHFALKLKPVDTVYQQMDANTRITAVFNELLDRQFPIESLAQRFELRSARDFADRLAVHVNHLNYALKHTTGKTTTEHILNRLASEAMVLLKHTDWSISEISYTLGFEDAAHFTHFFKKHTSQTPTAYRS